jgi:S-DNA-T family DNA segregation ATPase FtsK/SpoIIIE
MPKTKPKEKAKEPRPPLVEAKTKRLILGIIFLAAGMVALLSLFGRAGPAGNFIGQVFEYFFGIGEILIPLSLFLLAVLFLLKAEANFYLATIVGVLLLVASTLGVLDVLKPNSAGVFGFIFGAVSNLFGFWASLIILFALAASGILLSFESFFLSLLKPKEKKEALLPMVLPEEPSTEVLVPAEAKEEPKPLVAVGEEKEVLKETYPTSLRPKSPVKWQFPALTLLSQEKPHPELADVSGNARIIQRTLENFGIPVEMAGVHIGPTVTQYTLKPAQGVKLSKILALHNDLALALAAHPIRIEAPIPGKALVGIEVPNKSPNLVRLRNLLEELSLRDQSHSLIFPLGRDVRGQTMFADLAKMPHLLIAGATGSGKSIMIHSLILTLLFRIPPSLLRFLMIDPKRVELSQYEGIPYLLSPVITDGKKAVSSLRWAISEMDRRYELLLQAKARDIFSYNQRVPRTETLPFIVIFIDELADLMAAYGRDIEASIVRLSQMARATGIHLVVSTQRPSVEVITGLIKANITSRIAFQVASQVDSRTILDMAGAEKLLGRGDMLFIAPDTSKPKRIQAPFVEEGEVKQVVEFLRKEAMAFEPFGLETTETATGFPEIEAGLDFSERVFADYEAEDALYPQAYEVVVQAKKASASLLQRRLKIGYARAARLLDMLEAKRVIGPGKGAKPREVYVKPKDSNEVISNL